MPPLTATTLHSLQAGMNQSPIIFLQDALMQDWEGSAQNLDTTNNLKFQEKKKTTATNKTRTDGEAVSEEKKLKSFWVCFDRQQEGLRQRRWWQKRNNINLPNSAVKLLPEKNLKHFWGVAASSPSELVLVCCSPSPADIETYTERDTMLPCTHPCWLKEHSRKQIATVEDRKCNHFCFLSDSAG